jgi:hypothetical protein
MTAILSCCRCEAAAATAFADPGTSATETMRALLAEPGFGVRYSLVQRYLAELPAEDFPDALEALGRFEGRQVSSYLQHLLQSWARRDPRAALAVAKRLIDIAVGGQGHFTDKWNQKIVGPRNREAFAASPIWPEPRQLLFFLAGLKESDLQENERTVLRADFEHAYFERFADDSESGVEALKNAPSPDTPTSQVPSFAPVKAMLAAAASELPDLLKAAVKRKDHAAFILGASRWIADDVSAAPAVLEIASGDEGIDSFGNAEIVKAWARRDAAGALAWFRANRPEDLEGFAGEGLIAFVDEVTRKQLLDAVQLDEDGGGRFSQLIGSWSEENPKLALETALAMHGPFFYSACADECFMRLHLPAHQRAVLEAIRSIRCRSSMLITSPI